MSTTSPPADAELIAAVVAGDERAFAELIRAHHAVLLRLVMTCVASRATAEEVVQETWLSVVEGLDRFDRQRSLRTWIVRIALDIARARGGPSSLGGIDESEPSVDPGRFFPPDHARFPGHWASSPAPWAPAEDRLRSGETRDVVRAAIEQLPPAQRLVVTLRDVEGWPADEACRALELTDRQQRVLLHRARSSVRDALERQLSPVVTARTAP